MIDPIEKDRKKALYEGLVVTEEKNLELLEEETEKKIDFIKSQDNYIQAKKSGNKMGIPNEANKLVKDIEHSKQIMTSAAMRMKGKFDVSEVEIAEQQDEYHDALRDLRKAQNRETIAVKIAVKLQKSIMDQLDDDDLEELDDISKQGE